MSFCGRIVVSNLPLNHLVTFVTNARDSPCLGTTKTTYLDTPLKLQPTQPRAWQARCDYNVRVKRTRP